MKINLYLVALILAAVTMATISAVPPWRQTVRSYFSDENRQILAKITSRLVKGDASDFVVLKIMEGDQMHVEVYKNQEFLAKIPLSDKKDAFFNFLGSATNLAVNDFDQDGDLEILVPTYDGTMTPRLNIYKYNKDSNGFDRINREK